VSKGKSIQSLDVPVQSIQHIRRITVNEEYGTPQKLFDDACTKFNLKLEIDLAASDANNVLPHYITKKEDLFTKEITYDSFLNPPYGRVIEKFIRYAFEQHIKHNVTILMLIYSKTDTKWWHKYIEGYAEVHNIKGRIQFNDNNGNPKMLYDKKTNSWKKGFAPYPSVWAIFRRK